MNKKVRKSVVATSLAAATLVSSAFHQHVKAEEAAQNTDEIIKNDEGKATEESTENKAVTLDQVEEAAKKATQLEEQVSDEKTALSIAEEETEAADKEVSDAEQAVSDAEALVAEATPEKIQETEEAVNEAQTEIESKERELSTSQDELAQAETAVENQESKVAEQEKAVEAAKEAVKEATKPLVKEEQAVKAAQDVAKTAETDLANKQSTLKAVEAQAAKEVLESQNNQAAITQAEAALNQTKNAIQAKESEIEQAKRNSQNRAVLKDTGYAGFLATVNAGLFSQASQKYTSNGINPQNGGVASIQSALQSVEIMKAVNAYRARAGLPELYVDLGKNVESQIQTVGFERTGGHTMQYFGWETVAWGQASAQGGVDYWYGEKALYQQVAASRGLPTNETQINTWQVYQKTQDTFGTVGHYVTMMGNEFDTISAAVDGKYYEAGFHKATNLQAGLADGSIMTVSAYEKALRSYLSNINVDVNLSGLNAELTNLKNRQSQEEANLNSLRNKQTSLNTTLSGQASRISQAKEAVSSAEKNLQASNAKVLEKQNLYDQALAKMADQIKPQTQALETEEARLAVENQALAGLKNQVANLSTKVEGKKAALTEAQNKKTGLEEKLSQLKSASDILVAAQASLTAAKEKQADKQAAQDSLSSKIALLEELLKQAKADYETVLAEYMSQHPELLTSSFFARNGLAAGLENAGIEALAGSENNLKDGEVASTYVGSSENQDARLAFDLASASGQSLTKSGYKESSLGDQEVKSKSADKKTLPQTGSQTDQSLLAGLAVGTVALGLAAGLKKKED